MRKKTKTCAAALVFLTLTLAGSSAHAHNTTEYGYIRIDVHDHLPISTSCYNNNGQTGPWRDRTGGFRSCHGLYMLVHDSGSGGKKLKARITRKGEGGRADCGDNGLYAEVSADSNNNEYASIQLRTNCGYVEIVRNKH